MTLRLHPAIRRSSMTGLRARWKCGNQSKKALPASARSYSLLEDGFIIPTVRVFRQSQNPPRLAANKKRHLAPNSWAAITCDEFCRVARFSSVGFSERVGVNYAPPTERRLMVAPGVEAWGHRREGTGTSGGSASCDRGGNGSLSSFFRSTARTRRGGHLRRLWSHR